MFIDASVIVAILASEPGSQELEKQMGGTGGPFFVSPLVRFEATVALARQKSLPRKSSSTLLRQTARAVDAFIQDIGAEEIAISSEIGHLALEVSATYGKSVGHAAQLNFGDCFAYACAKTLGTSLIYKGDDFARTDLA